MVRTVVALSFLCGCGGGFDPVGTYEGSITRSGQVTRQLTDLQPDATLTADTRRFNQSQPRASVVVRRIDPTHLELDIGTGCKVRVEQPPEPNEHDTTVPPSPEQRCRVEVDGFAGEVQLTGTARFGKDSPTLQVEIFGQARIGDNRRAGYVAVDHNFRFDGQRPAQ